MNRKLLKIGSVATGIFAADYFLLDNSLKRNLRTLSYGALITADYKLNFTIGNAEKIGSLHKRTAERISYVCRENGGLYIKFGQQIASLNHVLPEEYAEIFYKFFDEAPSADFERVIKIFKNDFGVHPDELFDEFSVHPIASASIAQVHSAKIKGTTTKVAIKIQKPEIKNQMFWDFQMYKFVTFCFEKLFDLPLCWSFDYIQRHFQSELDFINEGKNSEICAQHFSKVKNLRENCYVPKIYWDRSSSRVLTQEWIDGVKLNKTLLEKNSFSSKTVMEVVVDIFSNQIFRSGFVHCDPHQGNILIRPHPLQKNKPQIVLIDHGLYVSCSPEFVQNYALFWKSLFTQDSQTLEEIVKNWGMSDIQMFATMTLQKPWKKDVAIHIPQKPDLREIYEMQVEAKQRIQKFLTNTNLIPKELIFIGRNLNIVRSLNKHLNSPVNRINLMATCAVKSLGPDWSVWERNTMRDLSFKRYDYNKDFINSFIIFFKSRLNYLKFQTTLLVSAIGFRFSKTLQMLQYYILNTQSGGFEEHLDKQMKEASKKIGFEIRDPFDG
ncbi:hypothetical protein HDU92_000206 [Lobulomyces angularis]|nr:hypothetical protein HDU92_000206 [Lobulomyces angularis]